VSPEDLAARLAEYGLSPDETVRKRSLFELVLQAFAQRSRVPPADALWVPGRLEIFGKHTDYGGGHSLVAPVPRGFALLASARADGVIAMYDASRREQFVLTGDAVHDSNDPDQAKQGWRRYALATARRLTRNFPGAELGADIVFASDLPPASGMSSSSALVVGTAAALVRVAGINTRPEWLENVKTTADAAGFYACIENGLAFSGLQGDSGVGTHGGSEDHLAIVCGRAGYAAAWRFNPIAPVAEVRIPDQWMFVIAASGVAARKTGEAKDAYNRLSASVRQLLDLWNRSETPQPSLGAALDSTPDAAGRLRDLIAAHVAPPASTELEARLAHFAGEHDRVLKAVEAFTAVDSTALGELARASQEDAERLLGNQVAETSALTRQARDLGAFAASSFGAGFGGSVWALVAKNDAAGFAARWLSAYRDRFPTRESATVFVAPPGPGLTTLGA
jgi:galactokinase